MGDEFICQSLCHKKRTQREKQNRETEKQRSACLLVCCLHLLYVSIISERGTVTTILSITTRATHYTHYALHSTGCTTLHYTTLHYTTLHYTRLHKTTQDYTR